MTQTSSSPDEAIVAQVISGKSAAYALLMQRYEQKLLRYVVFLIHDEPAAADIVQETFIKAYQNLKGYNPAYKFSSWIYRIAHNETMNAVKRNRHQAGTDIDTLPELGMTLKLPNGLIGLCCGRMYANVSHGSSLNTERLSS